VRLLNKIIFMTSYTLIIINPTTTSKSKISCQPKPQGTIHRSLEDWKATQGTFNLLPHSTTPLCNQATTIVCPPTWMIIYLAESRICWKDGYYPSLFATWPLHICSRARTLRGIHINTWPTQLQPTQRLINSHWQLEMGTFTMSYWGVWGPNACFGNPLCVRCLVFLWWKGTQSPHGAQLLQIHIPCAYTMYWMMIDGVEPCCGPSDENYPTPLASISTFGHICTRAHTLDGMHANTWPTPLHSNIFHTPYTYGGCTMG
jgi:hypothetical protein